MTELPAYDLRRYHWVLAAQERATDLSLADWRAQIEARGRRHWLTHAKVRRLRRHQSIAPVVYLELMPEESGIRPIVVGPGDLLRVEEFGSDADGIALLLMVRPRDIGGYVRGSRDLSNLTPAVYALYGYAHVARYPFRMIDDPFMSPPMIGDRVVSRKPEDCIKPAYEVAELIPDDTLQPGTFRFLDPIYGVQMCRRYGPTWALVRS